MSDEHSEKAPLSNFATDSGMLICFNDEQCLKAQKCIDFREEDNVT